MPPQTPPPVPPHMHPPDIPPSYRQPPYAQPPHIQPPRLDWDEDRRRLTMAFILYLIMWLGGMAVWVGGMSLKSDELMNIGGFLFFGSILPYIAAIVFAYMVQDKLNKSGLYKGGAWQIVVGALILNPYCVGFFIPTSVLLASGKIDRQQRPPGRSR